MSKQQYLDPVCSCSRIILLCFYPKGTKLRIIDNKLELVVNNYYELIWRKWNNDSRDDMYVLSRTIIRFIELYLLPYQQNKKQKFYNENYELSKECYDLLQKFTSYVIKGLSIIEETYGENNAVFTLQFYSNLLKAGLNNTYNQELIPAHLYKNLTDNLLDVEKIKNLWTEKDIICLCNHFNDCFNSSASNDEINLKASKNAIETILSEHEKLLLEYVNKTHSA